MKINEIINYVKEHYNELPESDFHAEGKCIIIFARDESCTYDTDFNGVGVTKEGQLKWYFCSGCSCRGVVGSKIFDKTMKSFFIDEDPYDLIEAYWSNGVPVLKSFDYDDY